MQPASTDAHAHKAILIVPPSGETLTKCGEICQGEVMSEPASVFVLDELELRPGMLAAFRDALRREYLPGARSRGMELLHTWVTPPVELAAGGTRVVLVWRVPGPAGFWRMRAERDEAGVAAWWRVCERFTVSRTRRFAADADEL